MPNDSQEIAREVVEEIARNEWTWRGIATALGKGAVGGVAGWAVGFLMDMAFSREGNIENLLHKFKQELLEELPERFRQEISAEWDEQNVRQASVALEYAHANIRMHLSGVTTDDAIRWHDQTLHAKLNAKSLEFVGFGVWLLLLMVYLTICEIVLAKEPQAGISKKDHRTRFFGNFDLQLADGREYVLFRRLHYQENINPKRIKIIKISDWSEWDPFSGWYVYVLTNEGTYELAEYHLTYEQALEVKDYQLLLLNQEADQKIFFPALAVIHNGYRWKQKIAERLWKIKLREYDSPIY